MKIVPFLAGSKTGGLFIFRVEIEERPDIYIWVGEGEPGSDKDIMATTLYAIVSFFTHTLQPLFAAERADEEFKERAMGRLEKCPKKHLEEIVKEALEDTDRKKESKDGWNEYLEMEKEAIDLVEKAEEEGDGWVIF